MLSTILIVVLILPLIGEASARRPAVECPAVANKPRRHEAPCSVVNVRLHDSVRSPNRSVELCFPDAIMRR
jgi:hypothetical protein